MTTILTFYNCQEHHGFSYASNRQWHVSKPVRYEQFLRVTSRTAKRNALFIFTTLSSSPLTSSSSSTTTTTTTTMNKNTKQEEHQHHHCQCNCTSPYCMDYIQSNPHQNQYLQDVYVNRAYKYFCSYFSTSTTKFFKPVNTFIKSFSRGLLLDTGCGDCKYMCWNEQQATLNPSKRCVMIGQDNNADMLCIQKYPEWSKCHLVQNDICYLPFRDEAFDGVLSVSVIQHLPNKYLQLKALREMIRVCRKGGRLLIYTWSFEKENDKPRCEDRSQLYLLPWKIPLAEIADLQPTFEEDGLTVDEKEQTVEVKRLYYLFLNGELEWLLSYCPGIRILNRQFDGKNWIVELQKLWRSTLINVMSIISWYYPFTCLFPCLLLTIKQ